MESASTLKIKLLFSIKKKSFVNIFGSFEVENVTVTWATRKYCYKLYEQITPFLYILRNFYKSY